MFNRLAFTGTMAATIVLCASTAEAAVQTLDTTVPATIYIEWMANNSDPMTSVDGDYATGFDNYLGGALTQLVSPANKEAFIGIMCNNLPGYELTFTASSAASATTGSLTLAGATDLTYTATLTEVAGSFSAGTTRTNALDLTGATVSGDVVFGVEADMPMTAAAPNRYKLTLALPSISTVSDGLIMAGAYTGSITATVALK